VFLVILKTKNGYFLVQLSQMFIIEAHHIFYEVHSETLCIMQIKLSPPSLLSLIFMSDLSTLKSFVGSVCL